MKNELRGMPAAAAESQAGHRNEWALFLLLAFIGLPLVMTGLIAAYGFVVWILQILFFGPPS
jgi:nitrate reductase NapE